jgi:hypothetical protein
LELGDVDQDIEEMAGLCDELLTSDISIEFLTDSIAKIARAVNFKDHLEFKICSEKVTDCLRKATVRLPDLHHISIALVQSLYDRFVVSPSVDDYKEGIVILDRILTFCGSGDGSSPHRKKALELAALFAMARFMAYGTPEDLEHAIYRYRTQLDEISIEDPNRAMIVDLLSRLEGTRTANSRPTFSIPPESEELPSFRDLIASLPDTMTVKPEDLIETLRKHFHALSRTDDVANIEDGIKCYRQLLVSHPWRTFYCCSGNLRLLPISCLWMHQ